MSSTHATESRGPITDFDIKEVVVKMQSENSKAISLDTSISCASVVSTSTSKQSMKWKKPYQPTPVINQSTILTIGFFLFALAVAWPPLILLFAYVSSKLIPYSFRENDDASKRRQLYTEFSQEEDLPENFVNIPDNMNLEESYWVNARGMVLCTSIMTPRHRPITAVVCFCHGYTDNASFVKRIENQRLVEEGIAFVTIEYEGHGRSDGPLGLINDWETMIDDVSAYFQSVALKRFHGKPVFLMGESMGGAIAYSTYNRIPEIFRGVVFVCPMCKISDDMLPPKFVVDFLIWLIGPSGTTSFLGFLPIAPSKGNLSELSHKMQSKSDLISRCPLIFGRNPRLATARELIQVTKRISSSLADFDAPFMVLHGKDDRVTDPNLSQALFDESKSSDKTIRLYDGMWHALTCGEPDKNIDRVFDDAIEWILARSK